MGLVWKLIVWLRHILGFGGVEPAAPVVGASSAADTGIAAEVIAEERYEAGRWNRSDWVRFIVRGRRPEPIPSFTGPVERAEVGKIGIACSGGGIRSASFNLGALQSLQAAGVLKRSHYLSSVSGGSYIAAAFAMVRKTWPAGERPPQGSAGHDDSDPGAVNDKFPPFFPGSPEEQYLRNRSSYLAPGFFDKVQLGLRIVLGLVFNLAVIGLLIVAIAVPLAALYGAIYPSLGESLSQCSPNCDFSAWPPPQWLWISLAVMVGLGLLLALGSLAAFRWPGWMHEIATTWSLRLLLLAAGVAALLIGIPVLLALVRSLGETTNTAGVLEESAAKPEGVAAVVAGGSVTAIGAAVVLQLRAEVLAVRKVAKEAAGVAKWYTGLGQRLRRLIPLVIATVVGPLLALALALVVMSAMLNLEDTGDLWVWAAIFAAALAIVYAVTDLTSWSLHPFYRRRLASAFALKRVTRPPGKPPIGKPEAGIAAERDYDQLLKLSSIAIEPDAAGKGQWPTLLVCAAANISDNAATPPGRAVTSFTFSHASVGGPLVGAVSTAELERSCDRDQCARITLPAAVAMSGAALSPSMGKMTRRPLRMLMGIANVRLGVWVPNPRRLDAFRRRDSAYLRPRTSYLLRELFGLNPINAPFIYVSDGGHYENLGVIELLRRGCTEVYCFDASNDKLDALGDLVSLARSELEVEIEIDADPLCPDEKTGVSAADCVTGTLTYADGTPGKIHYARPVIVAKPPADVSAYHGQDPRFPHDPTGDQLYSDQRFEAYRSLGLRAGRSALAKRG